MGVSTEVVAARPATLRLLVTVEEAAAALSISRAQCYVLLARGALGAPVKIGRRRLIRVAELEEFCERLACEGEV